jgi:ketosteroid isomerase-like protein
VSADDLEANKDLARRFVAAFDDRDLAAIDDLLNDDFVWHVAVAGDGETEHRPFQSVELQQRSVPLPPVRQDKVETLAYFARLFAAADHDERHHFHLRLRSVMAEADRVAFEAEGDLRSPINDRHYRNLYFILMQVRDGRISLYKEYQDTLHIYDVFVAE